MDNIDFNKFKIELITKQNILINIDHPMLSHINDKERKGNIVKNTKGLIRSGSKAKLNRMDDK